MCFQKTDCGTWINCRQGWIPDGPVTIMDEWNPTFTAIVETRYFLPNGTQTTTAPAGLSTTTTISVHPVDSVTPLTINANDASRISLDPTNDAEFEISVDGTSTVYYSMLPGTGTWPAVSPIVSEDGSRINNDIVITVTAGVVNVVVTH